MIKANLATRPFYNDRAVRLWLVLAAVVVAAATVFNVSQVLRYSSSNTELEVQAAGEESRAADVRARALRLRNSVDATQVDAVSVDARQANELIDRRTFSWTELLNRFERTLPDDVRITAVRPSVDRERNVLVSINVLAKSVEAINQFMENLDATGSFVDLRSSQERATDDGQIESSLQSIYRPTEASGASAGAAPATERVR
ncbi:MAG: PilN domain-containing protein [Vicinamibacterales bacterium]